MPEKPSPIHIKIAPDNNLLYLPFVYILPEDVMAKCPTLSSLPRCFGEIARSDSHMDTVMSDIFLKEIIEAIAALVFPYLGFRGWKEDYTEHCPVWILAYNIPLWARYLEREIGWGLQALFDLPAAAIIPFFDSAFIKRIIEWLVKRGVENENWQNTLDVVKEMPCDEDFEKRDTNVRKDFLRRWYHTRSKQVRTISLESCLEDDEHGIHEVEDVSSNFEGRVAGDDFCRNFKAHLSEKDMKILDLRVEGFTYEEIAVKLGYKNHSGVLKRIQFITKEFTRYERGQK